MGVHHSKFKLLRNGGIAKHLTAISQKEAELIKITKSLRESEEKYENIANHLDVGLCSMNTLTNEMAYTSPVLEKLTGYTLQDFATGQKSWTDMIHPDDIGNFLSLQSKLHQGEILHQQYRIINAQGEIRWIKDKTIPILDSDGQLIRVDGIVQDITERNQNEKKGNFYAFHDYLTELPNRRMLDQRLEQLIADTSKFALLYLDIDRFKFVNDTLGHEIGDVLLCEIARRLSSKYLVGKNDIFRVSGDEFAIIQQNIHTKEPLVFGEEIIREIEKPFCIEGYDIHLTTSIGISIFPSDGETVKKLKMNSDSALFQAKELGKNNAQLFNQALNNESYKLFTLENDLRKAIQREEFILHYQPRVDSFTKKVVGAEALIRWNHSKWGLVPPIEFIPFAEETGFINDISDWVIEQVCIQLKEWKGKGHHLIPISINLPPKTLMKDDLAVTIQENLEKYGISPSLIEIEITEDSLIKNEGSSLSTIQQLRDMGIAIALDDFGTGYSSIGYLKKFKVDFIKIDRSFIKDILENEEDATIVQSIILLANGFKLKVVAEGVETETQWELLKSLNCHYIQGFYFSKPLPVEQFDKHLSLK